MTDLLKGMPQWAKILTTVGVVGFVVLMFGYTTYSRESEQRETNNLHREVIKSVQKNNEVISTAVSKQTDLLQDLKQHHSRTEQSLERVTTAQEKLADQQERLQKWLERRSPVVEAAK